MEEYLYQKEYVMLNNMQLHLSNPEPMLKYIDEKVEKLIKAKSKNEEINTKLEILDEFYKILKYDSKNTICPEPLGHFETKEEKDELIKKKIKINDLVYYLGNICINYHKKLISKEYRGRVPIITNEATIKFNEIYIRALNEYFETLKGNEYKGIFENPPKKQQNLQIIRMIEYRGVVFPMAEPLTNNKIECIRDEHAYGTAFILPTLIERFLIIQVPVSSQALLYRTHTALSQALLPAPSPQKSLLLSDHLKASVSEYPVPPQRRKTGSESPVLFPSAHRRNLHTAHLLRSRFLFRSLP